MAYDPVKAHEYYINYRKKGLKKGRKKGSGKKKGSTSSLAGVSVAGLNSEGKIEAALIKDKIKKEMNTALKNAKSDAERENIRREYSKKAVAEMDKLKADPKYAKPKAAKAPKTQRSSSNNKSSGSSSRSSENKSSSQGSSKVNTAVQKSIDKLTSLMAGAEEKIAKMTEEQKAEVKSLVTEVIVELKKRVGDGINLVETEKELEKKLRV